MTITATHPHDHLHPELDRFTVATPALLSARVATAAKMPYLIEDEGTVSFGVFAARVAAAQQDLRAAGVGRGDVVSMQLPNWVEAVVLAHAVWGMGAVLNPITPIYRGSELRAIFEKCRPAAVVVPGTYRGVAYPDMAATALTLAGVQAAVLPVRTATSRFLNGISDADAEFDAQPDDISVLMYTSGTTGSPKGVLHSHRTLLCEAWAMIDRFGMEQARVFMPSPLTHITGLIYGVMMPLLMDGAVALLDLWEPTSAVDVIERAGCTVCVGATPFLRGLVDEYNRRELTPTLQTFICGGADVPPALIRDADRIFATVVRAYGLTEMPIFCCGGPDDPFDVRGLTDGRVVGSSVGRIADEIDGVGELEVHGPQLFLGYLDETDNLAAFTGDGWFRTGDLARIVESPTGPTITIAGRKKDIIVRGGENISAKEIEDLLFEIPGICEIAIVGIPDEALGERACAVVVTDGAPISLALLVGHLERAQVARQKFPEFLLVADTLPKTTSGKIQKFLLSADAARQLAEGAGESR
ncbi:cyclohexanecarboxylate-CoA ligase [soil metagenome]